jgi:2-dehydro-3-deoxyphosphooctonate aldolase (KDO 8-P synthase)
MFYDSSRFLLIAGPCSLESDGICNQVAQFLKDLGKRMPDLQIVYKGSYDKANRTSLGGARGLGIEAGLAMLGRIREQFDLPVLTDVHLPEQVPAVAATCDIIQIPAFLCRQTDLLVACAACGRPVNVKKGQFLSPDEMEHVTGKLTASDATEVWQTERGTTFGYQNLVVDMRSFSIMRRFGSPIIFDATHSVQLPGAAGGKSGGQREFVAPLARAALAAGADGLFIETHPNPDQAISDGPNMVPLGDLEDLLRHCLKIWKATRDR